MLIDVKVPPVGESIAEGTLVEWLKPAGDVVALDEPLFTLETDKVTITINAVAAGTLAITVAAGSRVHIGQVVGEIDDETAAQAGPPPRPAAPPVRTIAVGGRRARGQWCRKAVPNRVC